jgi:hypothetical protein
MSANHPLSGAWAIDGHSAYESAAELPRSAKSAVGIAVQRTYFRT